MSASSGEEDDEEEDDEEEKTTCRSRFGEASQRLDGLGDESEGSRGGGILGGQNYGHVWTSPFFPSGLRVCFENVTHWVMWPKVEQIGGEDGRSEEPQENETAHGCEADVRIHYTNINKQRLEHLSF